MRYINPRFTYLLTYCLCGTQWRYCIRLENLGDETVQLRERHWRIFSLSGTLETVRGRGIIGKVDILQLIYLTSVRIEMGLYISVAVVVVSV